MKFYCITGYIRYRGKDVKIMKVGRYSFTFHERFNRIGHYFEEKNKQGKTIIPMSKWMKKAKDVKVIEIDVDNIEEANDIEKRIRHFTKDIWLKEGKDYPDNIWLDGLSEIMIWSQIKEDKIVSVMNELLIEKNVIGGKHE